MVLFFTPSLGFNQYEDMLEFLLEPQMTAWEEHFLSHWNGWPLTISGSDPLTTSILSVNIAIPLEVVQCQSSDRIVRQRSPATLAGALRLHF